ncbi:hypothetical protein YK56LOC_19570 [Caballeronia sp. HLA56]
MNKHERLRTAKQVAHIRTLQVERLRAEYERMKVEASAAKTAWRNAKDYVDLQRAALRHVLEARGGIDLTLVVNLNQALSSAMNAADAARLETDRRNEQVNAQRQACTRSQQLADLADTLASRAALSHARNREARQADAIEDNMRARWNLP